ncbi:hypothetical protein COOONC_07677 [Cooperia oncophora]
MQLATFQDPQSSSSPAITADKSNKKSEDAGNRSCTDQPIALSRARRKSAPIFQEGFAKTKIQLLESSEASSPSTRSASVASSDQSFVIEEEQLSAKLGRSLTSGRGRGGRRSSLVKTRGGRRPRITVTTDRTTPVPPPKISPPIPNVRRSRRSSIHSSKARDSEQSEQQQESHDAWVPAKDVNPNSALGILRRVSRYTRPIRSPSPQPSTEALPKRERKTAEQAVVPVATPSVEVEDTRCWSENTGVIGRTEQESSTGAIGSTDRGSFRSFRRRRQNCAILAGRAWWRVFVAPAEQINEPSSCSKEEKGTLSAVEEKSSETVSNLTVEVAGCSTAVPWESKNDEGKPVYETKEPQKAKTGEVVKISPSIHAAGRISSRAVRPSSRFLNADFISPIRRRRGRRPKIATQEGATGSEPAVVVGTTEEAGKSEAAAEQNVDSSSVPSGAVPVTKFKTAAAGRSHVMKTRRASDEHPRIRLKIKLGRTPWIKIVGSNNEPKTEATTKLAPAVERAPGRPKAQAKRYTSVWSHYVPSVKPVLGNIYYSDGTVEKLGVSVNAVMDRLLAEVCQDGIARHSAIINKREKRKRNMEKARERVHRLKEERAARLAQGFVPASTKAQSTASNQQSEAGPRVRNAKHRLMQKDFLYPSLKRGTKAEQRKNKEIRQQRSRNVMNQLAESTREKETAPASRRGSVTAAKIRPRAPSPFDPEKEERLRREAEQREKQKRLTMPISFNTFLSSKSSMLTAQPLLQPQRFERSHDCPDHFYRELLCESNTAVEPAEDTWNEFDMDGDDGLDVTTIEAVHIPKLDDYVAPPELDESAEPVAASVEKLLMRPAVYIEDDGISYLHERALEQPELRRNLLAMAIDCISTLHVARLSASGREAAVIVYNAVTTQASKMRDVICMFSREREEAVFWMHRYLIEMLPVELLASYLFLLRHTRLLNCQVKSIVRSTQNDSSPWPEITQMIIKYIEVNVVEPDAAELDRTIASASLPDVVFVLVAPNVAVGDFSVRDRHYDSVFKWLRDLGNPASVLIRLKIDETFSTAISEMFFTGVNMISRAVTKLVREHKQKRIVLVGWGTSCCFNHVVLNTVPGVSAIIDLAFPLLTIDGMRGEPDDDILLTYCPTLYRMLGSEAGPTTQEQICDFLSMDSNAKRRSDLSCSQCSFRDDTFKVDLMQLKIESGTPLPSPIPRDASPSPLPLSQLDSMRSNFQTLLKKAGNEKSSKWPEDRPLSSAFKEPRLPAKPGSAMASPVPARTDSPNLLDPASISLT